MSNHIKVSSINSIGEIDTPALNDYDNDVNRMIEFWDRKIDEVLPDNPDLIVLPEACDRYLSHSVQQRKDYYKTRGDKILDFFKQKAKTNNCFIAYSATRIVNDEKIMNSTQLINKKGLIEGIYDKNFLVPYYEDDLDGVSYGEEAKVIKCDIGNIACAICYDLNFDELIETYKSQKPNIILFSSMYHGSIRQFQWAYSLRSYFIGCISKLQNNIISPVGKIIASSTNYQNFVTQTINLDYASIHLDINRYKFYDIKKKYGSDVQISDPGYLGTVLISSESEVFTVDKIIKEFELELLDDYLDRARSRKRHFLNS